MVKKTNNKKVVKKDINKKPVKTEIKQEQNTVTNKRMLTKKATAILYFICGGCWLISAILYGIAKEKPIFDILLGLLFIGIGIFYLLKDKKERNNK